MSVELGQCQAPCLRVGQHGGLQMPTELGGPLVSRGDLLFGIAITATAALVLIVVGLFA